MNLFHSFMVPKHQNQDDDDDDPTIANSANAHKGKALPLWGNTNNFNINHLIVANIQGSPYFKINLAALNTCHEVIDEIYYKVDHLEPWERGSRTTTGLTGMCGSVRGVGAGGIASSCYCLLFKLGTLKLSKKQVYLLMDHGDSPYIRAMGFMYVRYMMDPATFWDWFEPYLSDEEEIDVKAGGGKNMTIGEMVRHFLEKLEWFDTRFPRIPVNIQKQINESLAEYFPNARPGFSRYDDDSRGSRGRDRDEDDRVERRRSRSRSRDRGDRRDRDRRRSRSRDRRRSRSRDRKRSGSRERKRSRSRDRKEKKKKHKRSRSRSKDRSHKRSRSRSKDRSHKHDKKKKKEKKHKRSRSRSKDRRSPSEERSQEKPKGKIFPKAIPMN